MRIVSLRVVGLRNLASGELRLAPGTTVLWGPNGSGKTSVLEALCLGLTGRSCRTRTDREAISFGQPLARVEVTLVDGEELVIKLSSPLRPGLLEPVEREDFSYLVMPIRLNV